MKTSEQLDDDILDLIEEGIDQPKDDYRFNQLALDLFEYQFVHNRPYHQYCANQNKNPDNIITWKEIPAVPTSAFKESELASFPIHKAEKIFHTSGTCIQKSGKHYLDTCILYNSSIIPNFRNYLIPEINLIPMLSLTPSPEESPHSSLVHMIDLVMKLFGTQKSRFFVKSRKLDSEELSQVLQEFEKSVTPVFLLGTSFSFVHFFDFCHEKNIRFHLPHQSRIMETGGFKGKSREIPKQQLYEMFSTYLGIPDTYCINEYGMTELGTQYYDNKLRNHINGITSEKWKVIPPWARVRIINPETLEDAYEGQSGIIQHFDLTNRGSVIAIQTEDIGYKIGEGFEILGRNPIAEPRGCSLTMDEIHSS